MAIGSATARVTRLRLALPWAHGVVVVSSVRADFPTAMETHLLRVAVGQAAIAIHTAQRLARERDAQLAAEKTLRDHAQAVDLLVEEIEPRSWSLARRIRDVPLVSDAVPRGTAPLAPRTPRIPRPPDDDARLGHRRLSRDARPRCSACSLKGSSNKEIAGTLWLSDRTVERHITSLYRKIGVARRSEATAFALRHGVTS